MCTHMMYTHVCTHMMYTHVCTCVQNLTKTKLILMHILDFDFIIFISGTGTVFIFCYFEFILLFF